MCKFIMGAFLMVVILGTGCASRTLYHWGGYDNYLYSYYKNPAEREQFVEEVVVIIHDAEKSGRIPPGLYAEYGYLLYESGNYPEAVIYFKKEQDLWPESRFFMDKMIRNANMADKQKTGSPDE